MRERAYARTVRVKKGPTRPAECRLLRERRHVGRRTTTADSRENGPANGPRTIRSNPHRYAAQTSQTMSRPYSWHSSCAIPSPLSISSSPHPHEPTIRTPVPSHRVHTIPGVKPPSSEMRAGSAPVPLHVRHFARCAMFAVMLRPRPRPRHPVGSRRWSPPCGSRRC